MHIIVEAEALFQGQTGIPVYCRRLLSSLATQSNIHIIAQIATLRTSHHRTMEQILKNLSPTSQIDHIWLPGRLASAWPTLARPFLRHLPPDQTIAHATGFYPSPLLLSRKVPYAVTVFDLAFLHNASFGHPAFVKRLIPNLAATITGASAVICDSEYVKLEVMRFYNISEDRIFVTLLGTQWTNDEENIAPMPDKNMQAPYFLYVSTLQPRKNVLTLLKAFSAFREKKPGAKLVIVGNAGWDCDTEVTEINRLAPHVEWRRSCSEKELRSLYAGARAFFLLSWIEGFGIPCLEAMSCGCPVVYATGSSMDEVVADAGIGIRPDDLDAAVDCMCSLWGNQKLCDELSAKGLHRAKQFTWEKTALDTIKAYEYIANK